MNKRVLVVGGVAGGATCATRLRRLDEKGSDYHLRPRPLCGVRQLRPALLRRKCHPEEASLLVSSPELFLKRFNIEVRTENEVLGIHRDRREIEVQALRTGQIYREPYDALVLAPGAAPLRPAMPGIELPGIFALRTIPDSRRIRDWIESRGAERAVIVGGGLVGMEMAENLTIRGLKVTVVDKLPQVLPMLDSEMAEPVCRHLEKNRVSFYLDDGVTGFEDDQGRLAVRTESGARATDLVVLSIGVKPETTLPRAARPRDWGPGGIRVDPSMRTSDPGVWAVVTRSRFATR